MIDKGFLTTTSSDAKTPSGPEGYEGERLDGKRHGKGTFTWKNGDKYTGQWENDEMHGEGTFQWESEPHKGDKYSGSWKKRHMHGKGIYYYSNGNRYEG